MGKGSSLVIAIYSHPEYYPPTLNAIAFLSGRYDNIYIVCRDISAFDWKYPSNVTLVGVGQHLQVGGAEQQSRRNKMLDFWTFSRTLARTVRSTAANTLLVYDYLPWLSYCIFKHRMPKGLLLWYHNHDVAEKQYIRKGSMSWWAWKSEQWVFPRLDIFSLPSLERKVYFPVEKLKGAFFFLPNFPSRKLYGNLLPHGREMPGEEIKLVYQGRLANLHGFEEIIPLLNEKPGGKGLSLVLIGAISDEYLQELRELAARHNTQDRFIHIPQSSYRKVIENALSCHIGIGIYRKEDIMNKTMGTASNKIYEYAATGMPVLIYDNPHFRSVLGKREWVLFTDTSAGSLLGCLERIIAQYQVLSAAALKDFKEELCFEHYFQPLMEYLSGKIGSLNGEAVN